MILTNNYNLPPQVYALIEKDLDLNPYKSQMDSFPDDIAAVFRTTELIGPPLVRTLWNQRDNRDDLVIDAVQFIHVIFGTALHLVVEGEDDETHFFENKFARTYELEDGRKAVVCGTIDEMEVTDTDRIISDNKTAKVTQALFETKKDDTYAKQLNVYGDISGGQDDTVRALTLRLRCYLKDHSPKDVHTQLYGRDYPSAPFHMEEVEVWDREEVRDFIRARIQDHLDNPVRPCTEAERCFGNTHKIEWAVMVDGRVYKSGKKAGEPNTSAVKIFKRSDGFTQQDAINFINTLPPEEQIQARVDERNSDIRCKYYCSVVSICPYAQSRGY